MPQKAVRGDWHHRLVNIILQFAILFLFWFILSGRTDATDLLIGAISAGLITFLTNDLFFSLFHHHTEKEMPSTGNALQQFGRFLAYVPWLLYRIIQANLQVAYIVLHPKMPVDPAFLQFRTGMKRAISRVTLANSITLTPGTVTVNLEDNRYLIHALTPSAAQDILEALMQNKVAAIFAEKKESPPAARWSHSIAELEP